MTFCWACISLVLAASFWKHHFVGAVCYADDVALLAPSPSALRLMGVISSLSPIYLYLMLIRLNLFVLAVLLNSLLIFSFLGIL